MMRSSGFGLAPARSSVTSWPAFGTAGVAVSAGRMGAALPQLATTNVSVAGAEERPALSVITSSTAYVPTTSGVNVGTAAESEDSVVWLAGGFWVIDHAQENDGCSTHESVTEAT